MNNSYIIFSISLDDYASAVYFQVCFHFAIEGDLSNIDIFKGDGHDICQQHLDSSKSCFNATIAFNYIQTEYVCTQLYIQLYTLVKVETCLCTHAYTYMHIHISIYIRICISIQSFQHMTQL